MCTRAFVDPSIFRSIYLPIYLSHSIDTRSNDQFVYISIDLSAHNAHVCAQSCYAVCYIPAGRACGRSVSARVPATCARAPKRARASGHPRRVASPRPGQPLRGRRPLGVWGGVLGQLNYHGFVPNDRNLPKGIQTDLYTSRRQALSRKHGADDRTFEDEWKSHQVIETAQGQEDLWTDLLTPCTPNELTSTDISSESVGYFLFDFQCRQ